MEVLTTYVNSGLPTVPLTDPWANDYIYKCPGIYGDYDLASLESDGVEGSEDENADITSWAEASLIGKWYEYTPTSALDIAFDAGLPGESESKTAESASQVGMSGGGLNIESPVFKWIWRIIVLVALVLILWAVLRL